MYSQTTTDQHKSWQLPLTLPIIKDIEAFISPYIPQYFEKPLTELQLVRGFMKHYDNGHENSLQLHMDNCHLTVSLCLVGECRGSDV